MTPVQPSLLDALEARDNALARVEAAAPSEKRFSPGWLATGWQQRHGFEPIVYGSERWRLWLLNYAVQRIEISDTGCWMWQGSQRTGYGTVLIGKREFGSKTRFLAHRELYAVFREPIAKGMHTDHLCRTPLCVNPVHLEPVTPWENTIRGVGPSAINAAKTECIHGHALISDNLQKDPHGWRRCRTCHTLKLRRRRAARKSATPAQDYRSLLR